MRRVLDKFLWRNFMSLSRVTFWLTRRFTHLGKLFLSLMCVSAIVGIDTQNTMSYQLFALSFIFLLAAIFSSIFFRAKFKISRQLPRYCSVGHTFSYRLNIASLNKYRIHRLAVLDINNDPRPSFNEFHHAKEPLKTAGNPFDRFLRYPRWNWMINNNTLSRTSITNVPDIGPGKTISVPISVTPLRRGILYFSHAEIFQQDQMGLFRAKESVDCAQSVLILPKRYPIPTIHLAGKRLFNPGGVANAGSIGDAEEFVALREYQPGDSMRAIHWKSWAKMNRPIVKQYQEEYFSRFGLILDTFGNNSLAATFEEAVSVASSFVSSLHANDTLVDLMFVANSAYTLSMGRGVNQTDRLLEVLASVSLQQSSRFNELYDSVEQQIGVLSSAVIILLSIDPERKRLFNLLQVHNIPYKVFLIHSSDSKDIEKHIDQEHIVNLQIGNIEAGLRQ